MNDLDLCLVVERSFKVMSTIAASISPKLLELETSNLVRGFVLPLLFDYRVLHTIVYCEAVRSASLATAWLLVSCYHGDAMHKLSCTHCREVSVCLSVCCDPVLCRNGLIYLSPSDSHNTRVFCKERLKL